MRTGSILALTTMLLSSVLFALATPAEAKKKPKEKRVVKVCQWVGTAPFCNGSCPRGWATEAHVGSADRARQFEPSDIHPAFGSSCASGTKALCCTFR